MVRPLVRTASTWWGATTPPTGPVGTATTWVGWDLGFSAEGRIAGFRQYVDNGVDGNWYGFIYDPDAHVVLRARHWRPRKTTTGAAWHQTWFNPMLRISQSGTLRLAVLFIGGHYYRQNNAIPSGSSVTHNGIGLIASWQSTAIFPFSTSPTQNLNANAIDILFYPDS
jgi:hypothetical protein